MAIRKPRPEPEFHIPCRKKRFFARPASATLPGMRSTLRFLLRAARAALLGAGGLALLFAALQFTNLPWRIYKGLATVPDPCPDRPTHILVMGGSGIPGESGLMRTFYAAQAARQHPAAEVLVAMPLDATESDASRAYLDELRLRGVPPARMRILPRGRNTREQALRLAEHLAAGTDSPAHVLIVTSPEHVRRTAACLRKTCHAHLNAAPAHPFSIEDPLPWRAAELDDPGRAPAVPDVGFSLHLRYNVWANLYYTRQSLRELTALAYYRLRGWI